MAKIKKIIAHEIIDSRAMPTIEAIVQLDDSAVGVFSVPSGASTGKHEAAELRDGDIKRYQGKGVLKNLQKISQILAPKLIGMDVQDQKKIDALMINLDGTGNKSNLGSNTLLALSGAIVKAQAASRKIAPYQYIAELAGKDTHHFAIPTPMLNILNGGKHAGGNLDFQEFLIVPPKANTYSTNLKIGIEIYYALRDTLVLHSALPVIGDEGGYAPLLYSNMDALKILEEATTSAGYNLGLDIFFSLDVAASNLKRGNSYKIKDRPIALPPSDFVDFYISLIDEYHLLSLEDPLGEDDWDEWRLLNQKIGDKTLMVADDLTTTNLDRLKKAISEKVCGGLVIKPNQVGTISETIEVVKEAQKNNLKIIVSHRSGETNDDFIADFAVGVSADYVKFGAPARGERVAKYNRLLEVEHELS